MEGTSARMELLKEQLETANQQNDTLIRENADLHAQLNRLMHTQHSSATINVESKLMALKMEDERDRMFENLEKSKKRYNGLHQAYLEKAKRCKILEEMFKKQKTLTGLVMKSSLDQCHNEQQMILEKGLSENTSTDVKKLKKSLEEAYDIIDELEFELESIDFLEMENQRLNNELQELKTIQSQTSGAANAIKSSDVSPNYSDLTDNNASGCSSRDSIASSSDVIDSTKLDQNLLTESLAKAVEAESNCLRRELLRYRARNATRPQIPPKPSVKRISKVPNT